MGSPIARVVAYRKCESCACVFEPTPNRLRRVLVFLFGIAMLYACGRGAIQSFYGAGVVSHVDWWLSIVGVAGGFYVCYLGLARAGGKRL